MFPRSTPQQGWQEVHDHCWVCPGLPPALRQQRCGGDAGGLGMVKALASVVCAEMLCWRIQVWSEGGSILPENGGKKSNGRKRLCGVFCSIPLLLSLDLGYDQCPPWPSVGVHH